MPHGFYDIAFPDAVKDLQTSQGSWESYARFDACEDAIRTELGMKVAQLAAKS